MSVITIRTHEFFETCLVTVWSVVDCVQFGRASSTANLTDYLKFYACYQEVVGGVLAPGGDLKI